MSTASGTFFILEAVRSCPEAQSPGEDSEAALGPVQSAGHPPNKVRSSNVIKTRILFEHKIALILHMHRTFLYQRKRRVKASSPVERERLPRIHRVSWHSSFLR